MIFTRKQNSVGTLPIYGGMFFLSLPARRHLYMQSAKNSATSVTSYKRARLFLGRSLRLSHLCPSVKSMVKENLVQEDQKPTSPPANKAFTLFC